jgi:hypothetical protein
MLAADSMLVAVAVVENVKESTPEKRLTKPTMTRLVTAIVTMSSIRVVPASLFFKNLLISTPYSVRQLVGAAAVGDGIEVYESLAQEVGSKEADRAY